MRFTRGNLGTDVAAVLRQFIVVGRLSAGRRINEVELARPFEVSRTPLREALCRLTAEGFVVRRPRRGFFVAGLTPADAVDLYGIRAILDPSALELAGLPSREQLDRLDLLNAALREATDVERVIDVDDDWHLALLAHCPNSELMRLIRQFMERTRPLERGYLRAHGNVVRAAAEHASVVAALRAADLAKAVQRLRTNMESGTGPVVRWFTSDAASAAAMRKT